MSLSRISVFFMVLHRISQYSVTNEYMKRYHDAFAKYQYPNWIDDNNDCCEHMKDGEWKLDNDSCWRFFKYDSDDDIHTMRKKELEEYNEIKERLIDGKPESEFIKECELMLEAYKREESDDDLNEAESEIPEQNIINRMPDRSELDTCFTSDEINKLESLKIPSPSLISDNNRNVLIKAVDGHLNKMARKKGALSKTDDLRKINSNEIDKTDEMMILLRIYKNMLKPEVEGQIGGRYRQKKRNAYKIGSGGKYGKLMIHLPGLYKDSIITAYKNGYKVYEKKVDDDTIDLLTKRFDNGRKYSELSKCVLNELNRIGELPIHKSSKKFQKLESKAEVNNEDQIDDSEDLVSRLDFLTDMIKEGDESDETKKEIQEILMKLYDDKLLDRKLMIEMMNKFCL